MVLHKPPKNEQKKSVVEKIFDNTFKNIEVYQLNTVDSIQIVKCHL